MSKFIFDGVNLRIHINPAFVTGNIITFSVNEIWSEWLKWVQIGDNSKYPLAFRSTGGDSIGQGQFVGTYLFMRNDLGWRGVPPEIDPCTIIIDGSFYGEDPAQGVMENLTTFTTDLIINRSSLTTNISNNNAASEAFIKAEMQKIANLILASS